MGPNPNLLEPTLFRSLWPRRNPFSSSSRGSVCLHGKLKVDDHDTHTFLKIFPFKMTDRFHNTVSTFRWKWLFMFWNLDKLIKPILYTRTNALEVPFVTSSPWYATLTVPAWFITNKPNQPTYKKLLVKWIKLMFNLSSNWKWILLQVFASSFAKSGQWL